MFIESTNQAEQDSGLDLGLKIHLTIQIYMQISMEKSPLANLVYKRANLLSDKIHYY